MKRVLFLEEAVDDLQDAKAFYDRVESGVGRYCVDSLVADAESLGLYHGIHKLHHGLHRALGSRFPFGIYYLDDPDAVRIVAILDLRREPLWLRSEIERRSS